MRVALLTTGVTEFLGLPGALSALFPGHDFVAVEDLPGRPFAGFTSNRLPVPSGVNLATSLDKMVAKGISLIDPTVPGSAEWDLVLLFDDLELANRDQPHVVCDEVRGAVERHLAGLRRTDTERARLRSAIRNRLSAHFAVPMIEAWFFGAPAALTQLGVEGAFHKRGDPEDFESTHREYLAAVPEQCTAWCRHRPKEDRPKWIGAGANRHQHPKGYLQWLLIEPDHKTCTRYRERDSAGVLARLDWAHLLRTQETMTWARALVEDLADALAQTPALATPWAGATAPLSSLKGDATARVLRNL
jgi:hypothetical protein